MSSKHPPREVAVFLYRGDRLLVLHRVPDDYCWSSEGCSRKPERSGGYWHVVAGALEAGETFAEAAVRELREETGLDARPIDLELEQSYAITDRERPLYPAGTAAVVVRSFHLEVPATWEPRLNEEHDRYAWAGFDAARERVQWVETQEAIDVLAQRLGRTRPLTPPR